MTTDSFVRWRGTALWRALDDALRRAGANGLLQFVAGGGREAVVGHLCVDLDAEGVASGTRRAAVYAVLHGAGWTEEDFAGNLALELCALLDRGTTPEGLAEYIARFVNEVGEGPSLILHERLALAVAILGAYRLGGGASAPPA